MKYVLAPNNVFQRFVTPGEEVDFSPRCTTTAKRLEPAEALEYGVSVLKMVTPPAFDGITQKRAELAPTLTAGVWVQTWAVTELFPVAADKAAAIAANLANVKADLSKQIDAAVIAIYSRPIILSEEYKGREKAAADYKAAGYAGAVPARLAGFATPAGMTATAAADLILSQAAQMRGAADALSDLRMRKYEVSRATTEAAARTAHAAVMAQIAAVAASLG